MSKVWIITLGMFLMYSHAFAGNLITCERNETGKGAQSLEIEITENTISITDLDYDEAKPHAWVRDEPGFFSYWGTDVSEIDKTNERFITHVRLDIANRKMLSTIPAKTTFTMEVAYIWESTYFDHSDFTSIDMYTCKKLE